MIHYSDLPTLTELEIQKQATLVHPDNAELRASFILGVHLTLYKL